MRILTTVFLILIPAAFAAEKHPWASFKPGSYAKLRTTSTVAGQKTVTEMTQTLVSIDANNAVVETAMTVMGQTTKTKTPIPLKAAATPANAPQGKPVTPTSETITAAGKSLACKCVDVQTNTNGMKTNAKSCASDAVPGGVVRVVSTTAGAVKMESVTELVEFAAK